MSQDQTTVSPIEVRLKVGPLGELKTAPVPDWPTALRAMGKIMRKLLPADRIEREPPTRAMLEAYERADVAQLPGPWQVFACADFAVQAFDAVAAAKNSR